ncbi:MAG: hypothetical protein LDL38_12825 [Flavobacterium piscis]|nr:hypothetical protein [Flavobacterium piscis]
MKIKITLISFVLLLTACYKKETVKEFPFESLIVTGSNLHDIHTVKFTKSDTVYLQRIFPEPKENFYAIISANEKIRLNNCLHTLNLKNFDSIYADENLDDGQSYLISINQRGKNKQIYIHGEHAPQELYNYIDSLGSIKNNLKFISTKQIIDFGDLGPILPPPPPPPPLKDK